jgi:hypothetical protein
VTYPHPSLEPILARTLGVPLFQEQLLRMAMVAAGFTGGQAEELRRAMGFKRSEKRMKVIEQQLREGMARQGIHGEAAEQIITSIASFALYGFPESHAASFAHIAYASAYLKAHYPSVFYAALLNNQPMGFYHPATLVKDAQRRGVHFASIDVEASGWDCTIESDGRVRLGLRYVAGLREPVGRAMAAVVPTAAPPPARCPKCGCDDGSMLEISVAGSGQLAAGSRAVAGSANSAPGTQHEAPHVAPSTQHQARGSWVCFCNQCAHDWKQPQEPVRKFSSVEDLIRKTGIRRNELAVLAEIGALASFGYDRRAALWQIEKGRPGLRESFLKDAGRRTKDEGPVACNDQRRAHGGRLRGHGAHDRRASDDVPSRVARPARRAARHRPAAPAARPSRAHRRMRDHAAAAGHGQRLRLPDARRRDRHQQRHHPAARVRRAACGHRRGRLRARRGVAAARRTASRRCGPSASSRSRASPSWSSHTTFTEFPPLATARLINDYVHREGGRAAQPRQPHAAPVTKV